MAHRVLLGRCVYLVDLVLLLTHAARKGIEHLQFGVAGFEERLNLRRHGRRDLTGLRAVFVSPAIHGAVNDHEDADDYQRRRQSHRQHQVQEAVTFEGGQWCIAATVVVFCVEK